MFMTDGLHKLPVPFIAECKDLYAAKSVLPEHFTVTQAWACRFAHEYHLKMMAKKKQRTVENPAQAAEHARSLIEDWTVESVGVILLNSKRKVISSKELFKGGRSTCYYDPSIIFRYAIMWSAHAMILYHNHPSGNTEPSEDDIRMGRKLLEGGRLLHINFEDCIVISETSYYSMAEACVL